MSSDDLPWLTKEQMVEVDRVMVEDLQIDLVRMMENAGRSLAHLARTRFLEGDPTARRVVVLAGTGGNGGGALVAARRLHGWGAVVRVFTTKPAGGFEGVPARQRNILERLGLLVGSPAELEAEPPADLVLDGVIGYSLKGSPRGAAAQLIRWANEQPAPVLSLDVPSGLDATSGRIVEPSLTIRAQATMTLALPKEGLRAAGAGTHTGELYLADIGVPPSVYRAPALGLDVGPLFAREDILRLA